MNARVVVTVTAAALAVGSSGSGRADSIGCPLALSDFEVTSGELSEGARCGEFIGISASKVSTFSYAEFRRREPVTAPYRVQVTVQRLSADSGRSVELHILGGIVLLKDGAYALYATEAEFARSGWQPLPSLRLHEPTHVEVIQSEHHVVLRIDGRFVERWSHASVPRSGRVGIAFKGMPDYRARIWFGGLRVDSPPRDP